MIDAVIVANELAQARACRLAAEAACYDVEELLWEMHCGSRVWQRLALIGGADESCPAFAPQVFSCARLPKPLAERI